MARGLNMYVEIKDYGALNFKKRVSTFTNQVKGAEKSSAAMATRTSRSSFKRVRDIAPPRAGRHGRGAMTRSIKWAPRSDRTVGLQHQQLNQAAPHWIIQEIGTGQRAVTRVAGKPRPTGRPTKGATYVRTVKSQRGRRISRGLVFATRGGHYTPPSAARGQQLQLRSRVKSVPLVFHTGRRPAQIRISREIKGQHFIKKGGEAGFREYRESVLAAARQQFRKGAR